MKKQLFFLCSIGAMIEVVHAMDDRKLVKKPVKESKERTALGNKLLAVGKMAGNTGHKKAADRILKQVSGPTAKYWRKEYEQDPQKKASLLEQTALCPSAKPSESKKAAAESLIKQYVGKLVTFKKNLESGSLEDWDKKVTLKSYKKCREKTITMIAESLKADTPDSNDKEVMEKATNLFFIDERYKNAQLDKFFLVELEKAAEPIERLLK